MEEKINIAELLKDCPRGMELDCTMFDNATLDCIDYNSCYPIRIRMREGAEVHLTQYGQWNHYDYAKCVIFPKGKTTWEGFVPPCEFKDGDILYVDCADKESDRYLYKYIFILKEIDSLGNIFSYCHLSIDGFFSTTTHLTNNRYTPRFATEEEKQILFDEIKAKGYKWNAETKTLETLPKDKFDINTLVPFESRILIRDYNDKIWVPAFWGKLLEEDSNCKYLTSCGCYKYCIPYDGNEHLLGTTDNCNEYYQTWNE